MRHPQLEIILEKLRIGLKMLYGERLAHVILYGSQARDDAGEYSDIDILIVLAGDMRVGEEIEYTGDLIAGLSLEYNTVLAAVFMSFERYEQENSGLLLNVHDEGVRLL